jgi:hypothetical protein
VPDGVNIMANTSVLALAIPLAPVTLAFGPATTVVLMLTLGLAGTAVAWYFVLSRRLVDSRVAAALGAGFAAFAPGMISQATGHVQIASQFLVPVIIWRVLDLRSGEGTVRRGVVLGLLIVLQAFIGEEVLFFTALGLGLFVAAMALLRPELRRDAKPFLTGLAVAGTVTIVLLAYPLWLQFRGPMSYHGLRPDIRALGADLAAFGAYSSQSLAGAFGATSRLASPTEENAFYGWPLLDLLAVLVVWLRRDRRVLALAAIGVVFFLCSLGPTITWRGEPTGIPAPWRLLQQLPILDSAVPTRFALAMVPLIAVILALAYVELLRVARRSARHRRALLVSWHLALAVALVPIAPTPLRAGTHAPTPDFIASGTWRQYVDDEHTLLNVPAADSARPASERWSAETGLDVRIPLGYFLAPASAQGPLHGVAIYTGRDTPTSRLLRAVARTGAVPDVTEQGRRQAVADLRHWRTAVVVVDPGQANAEPLLKTTAELLGFEPTFVGGLWIWDVRSLTA